MTTNNNAALIETIFKLSRLMKENMSYNSSLTKLSLLQIQALLFLSKAQNAQMRDIAEQFKIEMPTATSLVNKLCRMDLVIRKQDSMDRRLVRISLTEQGTELLAKAMKQRSKKLHETLSYLTSEDKQELLRILIILTEKMEAQVHHAK